MQHGQALNAHAKSEAGVALAIDTTGLEHIGVHHAAATYLQPSGLTTNTAANTPAVSALDIHFRGRFREREIGGPKTYRQIRLEKRFEELIYRPFEVGKTDSLVDHQALDLMEHRGVGEVGITAIHPARTDYANRRRLLLHNADLNRRSMSSQNSSFVNVEGVMHGPSRVVGRDIQRFEIVVIVLNLGASSDFIAQPDEKILYTGHGSCDGMQATQAAIATRQRNVDSFLLQFGFESRSLEISFFIGNLPLEFLLDFVNAGPRQGTFLGGELA